ncbi:hypothetical protein A4X13_0g4106 [Tilletia indica]|uniref:DUF4219 domain-containing protein n=1 Tax=Tilletia indica TaxID=43049 RepID=A0A177TAQ8_9BASI|nr:hypothetical protein A4X13_0g4106 [Tilletia indica]
MTTEARPVEKLVESITRFDGYNWPLWSFQVKMVLRGNGLWSTVDPGNPPTSSPAESVVWYEKADRALAVIALSCSIAIQTDIMASEKIHSSPKDLFEYLQSRYAARSELARRRLRHQIDVVLSNKLSSDVSGRMQELDFLGRLYDRFREVGGSMDEANQCAEVVRSLSDPALVESVRDIESWRHLVFKLFNAARQMNSKASFVTFWFLLPLCLALFFIFFFFFFVVLG